MSSSLKLLQSFTRVLPNVRGVGRLVLLIQPLLLWLVKKRKYKVSVLGSLMELDIGENVDYKLMMIPQIYDRLETDFLKSQVKEENVFVDIGGHIGMYACLASRLVGPKGVVLTIEADPTNYKQLCANLNLNKYEQAKAINIGVSDQEETLQLYLNTTGNRSGNTFLKGFNDRESVTVKLHKLVDILLLNQIDQIDFMKIDIEGFEYKVLNEFFAAAEKNLWPRFIMTEHHPSFVLGAGGDTLALLRRFGYVKHISSGINFIMKLT